MFYKFKVAVVAAFAPERVPEWFKENFVIPRPLEPLDLPDDLRGSMICLTGTPPEDRNYSLMGYQLDETESLEWVVAHAYATDLYQELDEQWDKEYDEFRYFKWRVYFANQILKRI